VAGLKPCFPFSDDKDMPAKAEIRLAPVISLEERREARRLRASAEASRQMAEAERALFEVIREAERQNLSRARRP
jgi:hypothetical protein